MPKHVDNSAERGKLEIEKGMADILREAIKALKGEGKAVTPENVQEWIRGHYAQKE